MRYMYLCHTPDMHCTGARVDVTSAGRVASRKAHTSRQDAYACHVLYLKKQLGAEQVGPHQFRLKEGGPILVLRRPSQYGARIKRGKGKIWIIDETIG